VRMILRVRSGTPINDTTLELVFIILCMSNALDGRYETRQITNLPLHITMLVRSPVTSANDSTTLQLESVNTMLSPHNKCPHITVLLRKKCFAPRFFHEDASSREVASFTR
jgi:hypothetical protein